MSERLPLDAFTDDPEIVFLREKLRAAWAERDAARQQVAELREALASAIQCAEISMSGRGPQYPLDGTIRHCRMVLQSTVPRESAMSRPTAEGRPESAPDALERHPRRTS